MRHLPIQSKHYIHIHESFVKWMNTIGYSQRIIYSSDSLLKEFIHFLESNHIQHIRLVDEKLVKAYIDMIKQRPNFRTGKPLSSAMVNCQIQMLGRLSTYLKKVKNIDLPTSKLRTQKNEEVQRDILSTEEIQSLFDSTDDDALGMRDRAMLAVFYGCGLRRNEGVMLDLEDVVTNKSLVYVKNGKNYKERIVPVMDSMRGHIEQYLNNGRPQLVNSNSPTTDALFLSERGQRVQSQSLLLRLKRLQSKSTIQSIKEKKIGLHTLRHSIATHLLHKGMRLESIASFLGHSSLESTQIYTHIAKQLQS